MKFFGALVCLCMISAAAYSVRVAADDHSRLEPGLQANSTPTPSPTPSSPDPAALYSSYRGVLLRAPVAQVVEKLGAPTQKTKGGDFYLISPTESVQISYEYDETVKSMSINFTGDLKSVPNAKDVVGVDVKKDADGMISKMVSFPKDGYWASYTRTSGKDAAVIITLHKLAPR